MFYLGSQQFFFITTSCPPVYMTCLAAQLMPTFQARNVKLVMLRQIATDGEQEI